MTATLLAVAALGCWPGLAAAQLITGTVFGIQAAYDRPSGLQISAVTMSGTNRLRGSLYDVMRDSRWNAISRTTMLNRDPKLTLRGTFKFEGRPS